MKNIILKNKIILITGGTGSFGSRFLSYLMNLKLNKPKKLLYSVEMN